MNLVFQIGIIAYLFFLVPFFAGMFEAGVFRKQKKSVSAIFVNGYLLTMALFCVIAIVAIRMKMPLSGFAKLWVMVSAVISLAGLVLGRKELSFEKDSAIWLLGAVFLLSVLLSIGFTKPDSADMTVEIVATSFQTDSMYRHDAYTGYLSMDTDEGHAFSPIEMFYAVGASLSGMEAGTLVYYVMPVSLLLFFFLSMWQLASVFFENKEGRTGFVLFATVLYWMTTWQAKSALVTGIFLNSWHGLTLLSCVILPVALSYILDWMKQDENGIKKMEAKMEKIYTAVVLLLAGQLTYDRGGFYVACMLILAVMAVIAKGGYEHGVASGRFKKRI